MRILAIDTATQVCGAALVDDETLIGEFRFNQKNVHNEKLVLSIERLLADTDSLLSDVKCIAVSIGPGSFTGLRIGLSVAKGLCYTLGIPLVGVNTLDALAFGVPVSPGKIGIALKAREGEAYFASYNKQSDDVSLLGDYQIVGISDLERMITEDMPVFGIPEMLPRQRSLLSDPLAVARLGYRNFLGGKTRDPAAAEPFYLQDFEVKKRKRSYV